MKSVTRRLCPNCRLSVAFGITATAAIATACFAWWRQYQMANAAIAESQVEQILLQLGGEVYWHFHTDQGNTYERLARSLVKKRDGNHVGMVVTENKVLDDTVTSQIRKLRWLRTLDVSGSNFSNNADFLTGLNDLWYLDVSGTSISDAQMKPLWRARDLEHLYLHNTEVTDSCVANLVRTHRLSALSFGPGDFPKTLEAIENSKTLKHVWIHVDKDNVARLNTSATVKVVFATDIVE